MLAFFLINKELTLLLLHEENITKQLKKWTYFYKWRIQYRRNTKFKIFNNLENLGKFDLVINSLKAHSANQTAKLVSNLLHETL